MKNTFATVIEGVSVTLIVMMGFVLVRLAEPLAVLLLLYLTNLEMNTRTFLIIQTVRSILISGPIVPFLWSIIRRRRGRVTTETYTLTKYFLNGLAKIRHYTLLISTGYDMLCDSTKLTCIGSMYKLQQELCSSGKISSNSSSGWTNSKQKEHTTEEETSEDMKSNSDSTPTKTVMGKSVNSLPA